MPRARSEECGDLSPRLRACFGSVFVSAFPADSIPGLQANQCVESVDVVRFVLRKFTLARELLIKACLSFLLSRAARDEWGSQERTVSMSSRDEPATNSRAISRIAVSGFKSIQKKQEIELRPLTILAGANSSGKSTMMQSLLLL